MDEMSAFSFALFVNDFVNQHDLLRRRKPGKEEEQNLEEDNFDFKPYRKRFPFLNETNLPHRASAQSTNTALKT